MSDTQDLVATLYKDDQHNPVMISNGQDEIFRAVAMKLYPRLHVMCHTRFGKSMDVGLAVLTRAATFPERWAIIAGKKDKAQIIMNVVNGHLFDNEYVKAKFIPDSGDNLEEIRRYRNKNHITFKLAPGQFSEIFIGSASDALGFGAPNVIEDESALIDDNDHSLVMRMLGDDPKQNFLCKIGNPFNRNHFLASYHDPSYHKIVWDCYRSLKEGVRMTRDFLEEQRKYSFFKVLYECMFPSASEIDESGWMYLIGDNDIIAAQKRNNNPYGVRRLGIDVQRGGRNYNVWCLRDSTQAKVLQKSLDNDIILVGDTTLNFLREQGVQPYNTFVDDSGVGGGVTDYLKSRGCHINPVNFGGEASKVVQIVNGKQEEKAEYLNVRAEVYAGREGLQTWLKTSGQLIPHEDWIQLTKIRYRKNAQGKVQIEPKEKMRERGIESPDVADALALTFAKVKINMYHGVSTSSVQTVLAPGVPPFGGVSW